MVAIKIPIKKAARMDCSKKATIIISNHRFWLTKSKMVRK